MPPFPDTSAPVERVRPARPSDEIPRAERWLAAFLLCAAFLLRCFYIFRFRYDSDEPQHLHTTWGWTQGLLQYRDFFDNHTPLFHLLFSPLVAALGERTDILTCMRFAMVPLWAVALWAVWHIGSCVYSRRAGLWAAVLLSLLPWWFFVALEYRTDNLWTPLWLCALAVLLTGPLTLRRTFAGGILLGLCCCTSMKTSLLLTVSGLSAFAAPLIVAGKWDGPALRRMVRPILCIAGGLLIAPAAVCAFFAARGCWSDFYYCVITHNVMPSVDANVHPWSQRLAFSVALPFLLYGAICISRHTAQRPLAIRRVFLFLFAGLYDVSLQSFWALLTRQDYLPFYPVALLAAAPFLLWALQAAGIAARRTVFLAALGVTEIALILGGRPPWIDGTRDEREILREVLQLTQPGERVMDFKGESVFRQRAFHYVIEPLTYRRMRLKMIEDTIPKNLVENRTPIVVNRNRWYLASTRNFLTENYLNIGQVRVPGRILSEGNAEPGTPIPFSIAIPARYVLVAEGAPVRGLLDGQPYEGKDGGRELAVGPHEFRPESNCRRLALFWERAAQAGYTPLADQSWQYER